MALTETKVIDQITVTENGVILVREATKILRDGEELTKTYHRWTYFPGQDITGVPDNVAAICNVAWTQEVIDAYNAQVAANTLPQG